MKNKKATNKQIIDAYGQSYRLMQKAKQHDDTFKKHRLTFSLLFGDGLKQRFAKVLSK